MRRRLRDREERGGGVGGGREKEERERERERENEKFYKSFVNLCTSSQTLPKVRLAVVSESLRS
jgi:hypothetical protein